jgi:phosphonate transport system substrate-binding protein
VRVPETECRLFAAWGYQNPKRRSRTLGRAAALLFASGVAACMLAPVGLAAAAETIDGLEQAERTLVVGRVTSTPQKDYPRFKRFVDYLGGQLRGYGIVRWRIQFAKDTALMVELMRQGVVDLVSETTFSALIYTDRAHARLLLREWRDGAPSYRSVLFGRKDSAIHDLSDLRGKTIAFEDPGSTSAYFVPRAEIEAAGLPLVQLANPTLRPPPNAVGFVFAGSENNIITWVHGGLVDAGAFSDLDWEDADDLPPVVQQDLRIFYHSLPFPRSVIVVSSDLPERLRDRIKDVLLAADEDPEGRAMLLDYKSVTKFDELEGDAAAGIAAAQAILKALGEMR